MIKYRTKYNENEFLVYGFWQTMSVDIFKSLTLDTIVNQLNFEQYQYLVDEEVQYKLTKAFKSAIEKQIMWEKLKQ